MEERNDTCRYCGEVGVHGQFCQYSPTGYHEEVGNGDFCVWCGGSDYGSGCCFSQETNKNHRHGHSTSTPKKCIWCGEISDSSSPIGGKSGCPFSPTGKHQL